MSLPLLHSPADILSRVLIAIGAGTEPGAGGAWPIGVDLEPNVPDNCITVFDTAGRPDARLMDGQLMEHYGFQIRVRSVSHPIGYTKGYDLRTTMAENLKDAFVTIDATPYVVPSVQTINLIRLGRESPNSSRYLFTINGLLVVQRLT